MPTGYRKNNIYDNIKKGMKGDKKQLFVIFDPDDETDDAEFNKNDEDL